MRNRCRVTLCREAVADTVMHAIAFQCLLIGALQKQPPPADPVAQPLCHDCVVANVFRELITRQRPPIMSRLDISLISPRGPQATDFDVCTTDSVFFTARAVRSFEAKVH